MTINRFQVTGAKELAARLSLLPAKLQKSILRPALRKGASLILGPARANAPEKTGAMKRAIKVKSRKSRKGTVAIGVVLGAGFFKGDEFYGAFQEFGWHAGSRRRSVGWKARKITAGLRAGSRAARGTGRAAATSASTGSASLDSLLTMPLGKRGGRMRALQERAFNLAGVATAKKTGDDRRFIPGKHFLKQAADQYGEAAAALSVNLIRTGIIKAATTGI